MNEAIDGLRNVGCEPEDIVTMLDVDIDTAMRALQYGDDSTIMVPSVVADAIDAERRDALSALAASYREPPATEEQEEAPQGAEVQRYGAGTIGAMEPQAFFSGLSSALRERMADAVYAATGRK